MNSPIYGAHRCQRMPWSITCIIANFLSDKIIELYEVLEDMRVKHAQKLQSNAYRSFKVTQPASTLYQQSESESFPVQDIDMSVLVLVSWQSSGCGATNWTVWLLRAQQTR